MTEDLFSYIDQNRKKILDLLQNMIRIPSPTLKEGEFAGFLKELLDSMNLHTNIDPLGDVTGILEGKKDKAYFLLNTHLDHGEPGDMPDPYSGKIMDGGQFDDPGEIIYGRGVNGQKASLAGMIFAIKAVQDLGIPLERGLALNGSVMEECGGHLGPKYLMEHDRLPVHWVLSGEHTDLKPIVAHRGMINMPLRITGKGAHAAVPEDSSSALNGFAKAILALEKLGLELPQNLELGNALVSLNRIVCSPNVPNIIPDKCEGVIDIRHPASLSREDIVSQVVATIGQAVRTQPGLSITSGIEDYEVTSYTGLKERANGCMYPFSTPVNHSIVRQLISSIKRVCGFCEDPGLWTISSETGYFSTIAGLPTVGFGPGEDRFTHNRYEHVKTDDVIKAAKVYADMIAHVCCPDKLGVTG